MKKVAIPYDTLLSVTVTTSACSTVTLHRRPFLSWLVGQGLANLFESDKIVANLIFICTALQLFQQIARYHSIIER